MTTFLQLFLMGCIVGLFYGLVATGIALLFGVMKYMNMAHGSFMMLGGYASFWLFKLLGLDPFISIPIIMVVMALVGAIFYKFLLSSLDKFDEERKTGNSMLITFGFILVLDNAMQLVWSTDVRAIGTSYAGSALDFLGVRLPVTGLGVFGVALVVIVILHVFLKFTYMGKAIRATAELYDAASLVGINVRTTYLIACSIGVSFAGLAGSGVAIMYTLTPSGGIMWLLTAMVVLVLAGMGNIKGVIFGGLALGLLEQLGMWLLGGEYRVVVSLMVFVGVCLYRAMKEDLG